jgi:hypothetical protein
MNVKSAVRMPLQVVLGSQTIKAFVVAPKRFNVLGIVRMGMEYGLLAVTESGNYVRVNGSVEIELIKAEVEHAIELATLNGSGKQHASAKPCHTPKTPSVVVRKHRHVELPPDHSASTAARKG